MIRDQVQSPRMHTTEPNVTRHIDIASELRACKGDEHNLAFFFGGSGDMRNVMSTLVQTYNDLTRGLKAGASILG